MTLKELFIKRNGRIEDFKLNYYVTILVVSGYLAVTGTYFILTITIISYFLLKNRSLFTPELHMKYYVIPLPSLKEDLEGENKLNIIDSNKVDSIKAILAEQEFVLRRKINDFMVMEIILICIFIIYRSGIIQ